MEFCRMTLPYNYAYLTTTSVVFFWWWWFVGNYTRPMNLYEFLEFLVENSTPKTCSHWAQVENKKTHGTLWQTNIAMENHQV